MAVTLDTTNSLVSLTDLKLFMGMDAHETSLNDTLMTLINCVSAWFNNKTNRLLKARALTEYYDGDGFAKLFTENYPINGTVESVSIYIDQDWLYPESTKVLSSNIAMNANAGILYLKNTVFTSGTRNIKIVYNGGYSTTPFDLHEACLLMCKLLDKRKDQEGAGLSTISLSNNQATYMLDKVAPEFVLDVIKNYWRPTR